MNDYVYEIVRLDFDDWAYRDDETSLGFCLTMAEAEAAKSECEKNAKEEEYVADCMEIYPQFLIVKLHRYGREKNDE